MLCIKTIGKLIWGYLRNQQDFEHDRLSNAKVNDFTLRRELPAYELVPRDSFHSAQPSRHSDPCNLGPKGCSYCLNWWKTLSLFRWCWFYKYIDYNVVGSRRLPIRFQKKSGRPGSVFLPEGTAVRAKPKVQWKPKEDKYGASIEEGQRPWAKSHQGESWGCSQQCYRGKNTQAL